MSNLNQLFVKDFQFVIDRLPNVQFFCTKASIPSISVSRVEVPTPFAPLRVQGDKVNFSPLTITFNLDEDLQNYKELSRWIISYGTPDNFQGYNPQNKQSKQAYKDHFSDASLITSTNKDNPNIEFRFEGIFPVEIGEIELDIQNQSVPVFTCTATFEYTKFTVV